MKLKTESQNQRQEMFQTFKTQIKNVGQGFERKTRFPDTKTQILMLNFWRHSAGEII